MNTIKLNFIIRVVFVLVFLVMGTQLVQGQAKISVNGGFPIGDAQDLSTFSGMVDVGYLLEVTDNMKLGPSVGYLHSFGKDLDVGFGTIEVADTAFVPISGAIRFEISDALSFGTEIGYALGLKKPSSGGLYYAPSILLSIGSYLDMVAAYRGISLKTASWDVISIGLELKLN